MAEELLGNGGAAAVITSALGKIESQMTAIVAEQVTQRDLLTRFDERQRGWSTKHELSEVSYKLEAAIAPVAAKADAAHSRIDTMVASLGSLGTQIGRVEEKLTALISKDSAQDAEVRGAWKILRPTLAWVAGISAAAVTAFLIGRMT